MKRFLLIIFSAFITLNVTAQIIDIPDANFKAKLLEAETGNGIAYLVDGPSFKIDSNDDGEIQESEALLVGRLAISNSDIHDLTGIEYFTNLEGLQCNNNFITELDLSALTNMEGINLINNNLTSLNVNGLVNLFNMACNDNALTELDLSTLTYLHVLHCDNNQISSLDFSNNLEMISISTRNNLLESLDLNHLSELDALDCASNPTLQTLYIKNNSEERFGLDFSDNLALRYICADGIQLATVIDKITEYGYTDCYTNSICSYTEGGDFFMVSGTTFYDEDVNGCTTEDNRYPQLEFSVSDGTNEGTAFATVEGEYQYAVQAGTYTLTPQIEDLDYFSISPTSQVVTFPDDGTSFIQDFCLSPTGVFPDLKVDFEVIEFGFDLSGTYKIRYSNNGTMTQSGVLTLSFDDDIMDFNSAIPEESSQTTSLLTWDFTDLLPFESREIEFIMDFNDNDDPNPIEGGDILMYTVDITSDLTDETPEDNTVIFEHEFACCLSTSDFVFSDYFSQYPNPASDVFNLSLKQDIDVRSVTVYTLIGQEVMTVPYEGDLLTIDVSSLERGHYMVKIDTSTNIFFTRFIKK